MNILALESSSMYGSVAALDECKVLIQHELPTTQRTAQTLAPAVETLLQTVKWQPGDIDLIAVTQGPGSFTGLRIGVTMAKTMAYAVNAAVLGVNTLDVIARQAPPELKKLSCVIDAHRQQVFCKSYSRNSDSTLDMSPETLTIGIEEYMEGLPNGVAVFGPMLQKIGDRLHSSVGVVDQSFWSPTAAVVGQLAWSEYSAGRRDDMWNLVPLYYRQSAAEEKRRSKSG